jgi:hypothetical protein
MIRFLAIWIVVAVMVATAMVAWFSFHRSNDR